MLVTSVRYDSKEQRKRIQKAAALRHWSTNRFLLEAAERLANQDLNRLAADVDPLVIDKWARVTSPSDAYAKANLQQTQTLGESLVPKANNSPSTDEKEEL